MSVSLTCRKHPKYLAIRPPRLTTKHPDGCPGCNLMWGAVQAAGPFVFVVRRTIP